MGSFKKGYQCRCNSCRRIARKNGEKDKKVRKTFNHHPDWYKTPPICDQCGESDWSVDTNRQSGKEVAVKKKNGKQCSCDGIPWVHQTGATMQGFTCKHREEYLLEQSLKPNSGEIDNPGDFEGKAPF